MNWIKQNIENIFLVIVSVVVTLIVIDLALSFSKYRFVIKKQPYLVNYFQKDTELGFDIAPNFAITSHLFSDTSYDIWSNSKGCFDYEYNGELPFIYLTGDSFTWGFTPFEDKWGTQMEKFLGRRVLKCGVNGFGTKGEFIKTS